MSRTEIGAACPSFVVGDVERSLAFYRDRLGFAVTYSQPDGDPFFGIVRRDAAMLFFKSESGIAPLPNSTRHRHLRWDAYVFVQDPDTLAGEFAGNGVTFSAPLGNTSDGLRGFELTDPDGYVLFFGRPRDDADRAPT
jgi:catechol 2,3-dioxygenase-like lactoylglutathione lyase family enzyme